jgi:hypothetical protein
MQRCSLKRVGVDLLGDALESQVDLGVLDILMNREVALLNLPWNWRGQKLRMRCEAWMMTIQKLRRATSTFIAQRDL